MKASLIEHLRQGNMNAVLDQLQEDRRLLSRLTGISYHPDEQVARAAVEAFGLAAASIAKDDAEYVRVHLRRLFWLLNDESGGIGWRAPEMIGEVIARCPGVFDEFVSPLVYLLDMEPEDAPKFQPGVLRPLARIVAERKQSLSFAIPLVEPLLRHDSELIRDLATLLFAQL